MDLMTAILLDLKASQVCPDFVQGLQIVQRHGIGVLIHSYFHGLEAISVEEIHIAVRAHGNH